MQDYCEENSLKNFPLAISLFFPFCTLLFHSLFKAEFGIDHLVLGEHRER